MVYSMEGHMGSVPARKVLLLCACSLLLSCLRFGLEPISEASLDEPADADGDVDVDSDGDGDVDGDVDSDGDGDADGDGERGADMDDEGEFPACVVSELTVEWSTERVIAWRWENSGDETRFAAFELVLALSEEDVADRGLTSRVFDSATNPELGFIGLPDTGSDEVFRTMTRGLEPATEYFARIEAIDAVGLRSVSDVTSGSTMATATNEVVLFSELESSGYFIPVDMVRSDVAPYQGNWHWEWTAICGAAERCFQILRRQDIEISLDALNAVDLDTAFYEFAISSDSSLPSYWSEARLWAGVEGDHTEHPHTYGGFTIPFDGSYQLFQIPLRSMIEAGASLSSEDLARGLFEFGVGCSWSDSRWGRLDELRIRW